MKLRVGLLAATLLGLIASAPALAQSYPSKPVKILIGFAAGGPTDVIGRILAQDMTAALGQTFVVENRTGAGGTTGTGYVAKQVEPDGYTILVHSAAFVIQPATFPNLGFDTGKDFTGITLLANVPLVMIASPAKYKTLRDLVTAAKAMRRASDRLRTPSFVIRLAR